MLHAPIMWKIQILLEIISRNVYVVKSRDNGTLRMSFFVLIFFLIVIPFDKFKVLNI